MRYRKKKGRRERVRRCCGGDMHAAGGTERCRRENDNNYRCIRATGRAQREKRRERTQSYRLYGYMTTTVRLSCCCFERTARHSSLAGLKPCRVRTREQEPTGGMHRVCNGVEGFSPVLQRCMNDSHRDRDSEQAPIRKTLRFQCGNNAGNKSKYKKMQMLQI